MYIILPLRLQVTANRLRNGRSNFPKSLLQLNWLQFGAGRRQQSFSKLCTLYCVINVIDFVLAVNIKSEVNISLRVVKRKSAGNVYCDQSSILKNVGGYRRTIWKPIFFQSAANLMRLNSYNSHQTISDRVSRRAIYFWNKFQWKWKKP